MKNIAVVAGGYSGEYQISVNSAGVVMNHIDRQKYTPYLIRITRQSWDCLHRGRAYPVDKNRFTVKMGRKNLSFDAVFVAIHGTPGEDGKLQGYFDMLGIPYTSCGAISSALTFNKHFCKQVAQSAGILTPPSLHFFKGEKIHDEQVSKMLPFPVFVKPNCGGSSVGMSKVKTPDKLNTALRKAFREDNEVLIETFIPGRELTCGVVMSGKKRIVLPVTEIIPKREFFDFKAKYEAGMSEEIVPAQIPENVETEVKGISAYLFGKLNCLGVVRFDYIWNGKDFYFLEVNTVPGLSEASIVPKMALSHGFSLKQFYSLLIEGALQVKNR